MKSWLHVLADVVPGILGVIPALAPIAGPLAVFIAVAEHKPGFSGPDKRADVVAEGLAAVTAVNASQARIVIDPMNAAEAIGEAVDSIIATTNAVHKLQPPAPAAAV
jgi:hypothetical protein